MKNQDKRIINFVNFLKNKFEGIEIIEEINTVQTDEWDYSSGKYFYRKYFTHIFNIGNVQGIFLGEKETGREYTIKFDIKKHIEEPSDWRQGWYYYDSKHRFTFMLPMYDYCIDENEGVCIWDEHTILEELVIANTIEFLLKQ